MRQVPPESVRSPTDRRGFSLLEVIVTVAIIGIVAVVPVLRTGNSSDRAAVRAAARTLEADLRRVRHAATSTGEVVSVTFDINNDSYTAAGLSSLDNPAEALTVSLADSEFGVAIQTVHFEYTGNGTTLVFEADGSVNDPVTITLRRGDQAVQVTVSETLGTPNVGSVY